MLDTVCTVEVWRPVVGFESYYEVSNYGRVRSYDRTRVQLSHAGTPYLRTQKGRTLRPGLAGNGYPSVTLGRQNTRMVHRLVAESFLGPCPEEHETCYKDGDRKNSRLDNLYWGTRSDNNHDRWHHYRQARVL